MGTVYFCIHSWPFCVTRATWVFELAPVTDGQGGPCTSRCASRDPFIKPLKVRLPFVTGSLCRRYYLGIGQDQRHLFFISDVMRLAFPISDCLWLLPFLPLPPRTPPPPPGCPKAPGPEGWGSVPWPGVLIIGFSSVTVSNWDSYRSLNIIQTGNRK